MAERFVVVEAFFQAGAGADGDGEFQFVEGSAGGVGSGREVHPNGSDGSGDVGGLGGFDAGDAVEEFAELAVRERLGGVAADRAALFLDQGERRVVALQPSQVGAVEIDARAHDGRG